MLALFGLFSMVVPAGDVFPPELLDQRVMRTDFGRIETGAVACMMADA